MLNIHIPAGWSSSRQLHAVWPWAYVTLYPKLRFLQLENGVHYLLPLAVLSGNSPLSLPLEQW